MEDKVQNIQEKREVSKPVFENNILQKRWREIGIDGEVHIIKEKGADRDTQKILQVTIRK